MERTTEILNTAQELFGKYGFAKTTMSDIAKQLGLSKASLYYYYPDKDSIYLAVITKEQVQFINMLHDSILKTENPIDILYQYVQIRIKYFSVMMNLNRARFESFMRMNEAMKNSWKEFRKKEEIEIQFVLQKGIDQGVFGVEKLDKTTSLFLDTFKGLIFYYLKNKDFNFLDKSDFMALEEQLTLFTSIFIKGIKK